MLKLSPEHLATIEGDDPGFLDKLAASEALDLPPYPCLPPRGPQH